MDPGLETLQVESQHSSLSPVLPIDLVFNFCFFQDLIAQATMLAGSAATVRTTVEFRRQAACFYPRDGPVSKCLSGKHEYSNRWRTCSYSLVRSRLTFVGVGGLQATVLAPRNCFGSKTESIRDEI
jgi:hypothetical protein